MVCLLEERSERMKGRVHQEMVGTRLTFPPFFSSEAPLFRSPTLFTSYSLNGRICETPKSSEIMQVFLDQFVFNMILFPRGGKTCYNWLYNYPLYYKCHYYMIVQSMIITNSLTPFRTVAFFVDEVTQIYWPMKITTKTTNKHFQGPRKNASPQKKRQFEQFFYFSILRTLQKLKHQQQMIQLKSSRYS